MERMIGVLEQMSAHMERMIGVLEQMSAHMEHLSARRCPMRGRGEAENARWEGWSG
jgi:hypothetical protein